MIKQHPRVTEMPYMVVWMDKGYDMTTCGLFQDEKTALELYERLLQLTDVTDVFLCHVVDGPKDLIEFAMKKEKE